MKQDQDISRSLIFSNESKYLDTWHFVDFGVGPFRKVFLESINQILLNPISFSSNVVIAGCEHKFRV